MNSDLMKATWRINGSSSNCDCMLCHNYVNDNIFVMPRCPVCSEYYVPVSLNYVRKFAMSNGLRAGIPDNINGIFVLGKCSKSIANSLKNVFNYNVYRYSKFYPVALKGYAQFNEFISSLENI